MVDDLEEEVREGRLNEAMVFFITDISIVECAVEKYNTPSCALLEHMFRIKCIQFKFEFVLHITHCSGTRMI